MAQTLGMMLQEAVDESELVTRKNFEDVVEEIERKLKHMPQVRVYEEPRIPGLGGWVEQENQGVEFYLKNGYALIEAGGESSMKVKPEGSRYRRFRNGFVVSGSADINNYLFMAFSSR